MTEKEKINFYIMNKPLIIESLKSTPETKMLWRKLFWTTAKDSNEYKRGCVEIFKSNFNNKFDNLVN